MTVPWYKRTRSPALHQFPASRGWDFLQLPVLSPAAPGDQQLCKLSALKLGCVSTKPSGPNLCPLLISCHWASQPQIWLKCKYQCQILGNSLSPENLFHRAWWLLWGHSRVQVSLLRLLTNMPLGSHSALGFIPHPSLPLNSLDCSSGYKNPFPLSSSQERTEQFSHASSRNFHCLLPFQRNRNGIMTN